MDPERVCDYNYARTTTYAGGVTDKTPRRRRRPRKLSAADERRWTELADLALVISREIQYHGYTDERALSLTPSEGMVMRHLLKSGPVAPNEIAAATGLQRTNLSTTLRGLEQNGLIQREANPSDGRRVTVSPTDRGRSNYALVRHEWAAEVAEAAGHDTTHLDAAVSLLSEVKDGLVRARTQDQSPRRRERLPGR
jgi:DNA-binding MarR family transcriptional regulator